MIADPVRPSARSLRREWWRGWITNRPSRYGRPRSQSSECDSASRSCRSGNGGERWSGPTGLAVLVDGVAGEDLPRNPDLELRTTIRSLLSRRGWHLLGTAPPRHRTERSGGAVADNASTDATASLAASHGCRVVRVLVPAPAMVLGAVGLPTLEWLSIRL